MKGMVRESPCNRFLEQVNRDSVSSNLATVAYIYINTQKYTTHKFWAFTWLRYML